MKYLQNLKNLNETQTRMNHDNQVANALLDKEGTHHIKAIS